ncbi:MAG: ComEC/Rec2 family competence protein [Solirubrobacteraceae bacterium]|nr:ComEC/Rec2 family competence protein [Solirubrobacteraceae bacterium]
MTARWPGHHLLAVAVVGLAVGPRWPWAIAVVAALAWATQPRRGWAVAAIVVALASAAGGAWRAELAWRSASAPLQAGEQVRPDEPVEVLEPLRQALDGGWRATARLRGAVVQLRLPVSPQAPAAPVGSLLRVEGRVRAAAPAEVSARSRGIAVVLHADRWRAAGRRGGWRGWVDRLRDRAQAGLVGAGRESRGPPSSDPSRADDRAARRAALLRGMVLGDDSAFSDEQEDEFRRSGLAHLVAASGQNVALLAALVFGIGWLLGLGLPWRIAGAATAIVLYVPLAGAGPSIRRAGVMGILVLAALALGRPADRWWALLVAALVTVLVDPASPAQLGWQLSFAAVVGLLTIVEPAAALGRRVGLPRWAAVALAVPVAASLATAPVLAVTVGDVSLTGLAANVLAEPLVAPITWLGMIAGLLGPEGAPVTGLLVAAAMPLLDAIDLISRTAASPSWAVVRPPPVVALATVAAVGLLGALVVRPLWIVRTGDRLRRVGGHRRVAWLRDPRWAAVRIGLSVLLAIVAAAAGAWTARRIDPGPGPTAPADGVVVLDVGQGSATLLRQGGRTILVDAGPPSGRVVDRLEALGVERLDVLVLSHDALDHTGGAPAVATRLRPRLLVDGAGSGDPRATTAGATVRRHGGRVVVARRGQRIAVGPLRAEVRWPPPRTGPAPAGEDPNDRAVVVRATVDGVRTLVPADREGPTLRREAGGPVDLLVLPHHGSADDDVPRLLDALRPAVAVAQVGEGNGYGHPAPSVLRALRDARVPLWRSDRHGAVAVWRGDDGALRANAVDDG